jgi:hypothetical protein
MLGKRIEPPRDYTGHFALGIARAPLKKLGGHRVGVSIARLADEVEVNLDGILRYNSTPEPEVDSALKREY